MPEIFDDVPHIVRIQAQVIGYALDLSSTQASGGTCEPTVLADRAEYLEEHAQTCDSPALRRCLHCELGWGSRDD